MKPLNKNYVYDLSELTSEERKKLYEYLCNINEELKLISVDEYDILEYKTYNEWCYWYKENSIKYKYTTHNAKELFYTLENVQVDCSKLTQEQIEQMCKVFEGKGHGYYENKSYALNQYDDCIFLQHDEDGFLIDSEDEDKTTITYEKFMELFGEQKGTESGWYKHKDGSLLYVTSECKSGHLYGYGFDKDSWVYNVDENGSGCVFNTVAKNYKIPATKEEVEKRLIEHAITEHKYNDGVFEFKGNVLYYNNIEIMKGGIWMGCFVNKYATETFNPQPHYDNTNGSLYKVATERKWNAYIFDVVKRLERGGKKDPLEQEIQKSIDVLILWKKETDAKKN